MQDRAPTKPNRYAVYDDAHNFLRYEYHERADEPTQVGDALNKANLLPDAVATALGLTGNPQVKDALEKIKTLVDGNTTLANSKAQIATGSYTGTGTYGGGSPCSITAPFKPKLIIIITTDMGNFSVPMGVIAPVSSNYTVCGANTFRSNTSDQYSYNRLYAKVVDNTVSWYGNNNQEMQLNYSGATYIYVILG